MRGIFLLLVARGGAGLPPDLEGRYRTVARRNEFPELAWTRGVGWAAALGPDAPGVGTGPGLVRSDGWMVVGNARLDAPAPPPPPSGGDPALYRLPSGRRIAGLDAITTLLQERGPAGVEEAAGDFAVAAWAPRLRTLVLARDALGGRSLFYRVAGEHIAVSSRAALLASEERYDRVFLAAYLAGGMDAAERSVFAGVTTLPAGCRAEVQGDRVSTTRFWRPEEIEIDHNLPPAEARARFHELFQNAVKGRVGSGPGETWSHLSGGLDSSSIVSVASAMAEAGALQPLGGTITITEGQDRPERPWVQAVLDRYPLRNEVLSDPGPFAMDGSGPPLTDGPSFQYLYHVRDRWMIESVVSAGGRILLSGFGADHYLTGNLYYLADWIQQGRLRDVWREALRWAVHRRSSVWSVLREGVVEPMLGGRLARPGAPHRGRASWLHPDISSPVLPAPVAALRGRPGRKYADAILLLLRDLPISADRNHLSQWIEVRYPFMDRALVELALSLPPMVGAESGKPKLILREAVHELPHLIRARTGKGTVSGQVMRRWRQISPLTSRLLRDPILADLQAIDPQALRAAVKQAESAPDITSIALLTPLSLELWLQVRSGRWSRHAFEAGPQRAITSGRAQSTRSPWSRSQNNGINDKHSHHV